MGNSLSSDDFKCIGGQRWYEERCSKNFLVTVAEKLFGDKPFIPDVFRDNESIRFSRVQNIRLSESLRKIYLDNIRNYSLKSAAGVLQAEDTLGLETVHLQELSVLVNTTSSFEEFFIRRNALIIFLHRILRSAQIYNTSLRPALPGTSSFCTCNRNPHLEYCPMHDILDEEKKFLFLPLQPNMRVQRGPDWQWSEQDGGMGHQGTVLMVKEWKSTPMAAVRVKWDDNGTDNTYRYGGENCYDVILTNPVSHRNYHPLQGVEFPSCSSWPEYVNVYLKNGLAKSRGLFHSKIQKQRLQLMLPPFDLEAEANEGVATQAVEVIKEVLDLAMKDILEFFDEKRSSSKPFEVNSCSQSARMEVLFPFQIYLFSQVQGDPEQKRTETLILVDYLVEIHRHAITLIRMAKQCFERHKQPLHEILHALQCSILQRLVPFIMTCLYVGSLNDDIMIDADTQISEIVQLWTEFLNKANLTEDTVEEHDNELQTALFSKSYSSEPSSNSKWYFALLYILVAADSRYITGLSPPVALLDAQSELLLVWSRSYILSGGYPDASETIECPQFLIELYTQKDEMWKAVLTWMDCHHREAMWKSRMYRNTLLEFRLFIVLVHLSRLAPTLQTIYNKLKTTDPSIVPVPEDIDMIWKGVVNVREHLRSKKQEFQISKDVKSLQRSTSFTLSRKANRSISSLISDSESDSEDLRSADTITIHDNSRSSSSSLSHSPIPDSPRPEDSISQRVTTPKSNIDVQRSQSDSFNSLINSIPSVTVKGLLEMENDAAVNTEYSNFDPDLMETFKTLREIEKNYDEKLEFLLMMNQPVDITTHELAYQYPGNHLDVPFTRKTINNTAPPDLEWDELPESVTETIVQSVLAFLINTPSLSAKDVREQLQACNMNAEERAQAYQDSIDILGQLRAFPQASRLYLLGVQSALISTPNAATYRSRLSQLSPFTNSLDEIQMADFMANIHGISQTHMRAINDKIMQFCRYLMELFEECMQHLQWRLGTTVLWILSCDFNNNFIYDPFILKLPAFYQKQLRRLSSLVGSDVLLTAGPYWDANCQRLLSSEQDNKLTESPSSIRGSASTNTNTNTNTNINININASAGISQSYNSSSVTLSSFDRGAPLSSSGSNLLTSSADAHIHPLTIRGVSLENRNSVTVNPQSVLSLRGGPSRGSSLASSIQSSVSTEVRKRTSATPQKDPAYGCGSTAIFALANSLRVSYALLLIRQFYDHQLKVKQSNPQHMNNQTWSLDDVFMVFGYDSPRYFQCTRGMFNEFMEYFKELVTAFEGRCRAWKPSGLCAEGEGKRGRHGCFRSTETPCTGECKGDDAPFSPEHNDLLVSSGESLISYYLSLITWVLNTYIGGMIDWQLYGDTIWKLMYGSPRLRKLAVVCLQSIVPYTDYLPSMLNDKNLYTFLFSQKEVDKMSSEMNKALILQRSTSNAFLEDEGDDDDDDDDEEEEEENGEEKDYEADFKDVDPSTMTEEEKMQAFIYYLLHLCVHDDFCFGAMTEERLACAQCCPFFPYIWQRLSTEIVEEEDETTGKQVNKHRLVNAKPPSLQPKSLRTRCKMLIRPDGYGASHCNLVVAEEVVYLLRTMLESQRWKELIIDIFEVILARTADQITIEKKYMETHELTKRSENRERERIVWYSMGSAVLKVMGSISRRLYAGCRVRVRQQFMDHITDLDVLVQTLHQSSGTGYVIDYNINSGEVLVLLDQMQVPKLFTIYTLDVVDKVLPPANLDDKTRDFLITHVQRVIINLEYPDELFEIPSDSRDTQNKPFDIVYLQNIVLEQNAIYVFHQLLISFPESVRLLSKEFISVMLALALKPSPAKGIYGTEFIRYCFNHLAEQLIDTYPGAPHLFNPSSAVPIPIYHSSYAGSGEVSALSQSLSSPSSSSSSSTLPSSTATGSATATATATATAGSGSGMNSSPAPRSPVPATSSLVDPAVYGLDKQGGEEFVIYQPFETNRLKLAQTLTEATGKQIPEIYKALQLHHDNINLAADFLLENDVSTITDSVEIADHVSTVIHQDDTAAIFDFDCPRSSPLFSGQSVRNVAAKKAHILHSVPYFAQLEFASRYYKIEVNTIASLRGQSQDIVYPIDPTGVVVQDDRDHITLSLLDTNSGISRQVSYPRGNIVLHKRRFGNAFTSVSALRRVTARIGLNLDLRLLRELIITLLYLLHKQNINVFSEYNVKPHDLMSFTKLIHVFYSTIASKSYLPMLSHLTSVSALIYILKQTLVMMIKEEKAPLLLTEFMTNCWTKTPFGTLIRPLSNNPYYVQSLHPYCKAGKIHDKLRIPKAQALRIIFDDRCMLQNDKAFLTFYRDNTLSHVIGRFTGSSEHFSTLHVQGDTVYFCFEVLQDCPDCWGYGFVVEPLTGLSWSNDQQAISNSCFDWMNWELELLLDVGEERPFLSTEYFNQVVATIIQYICTYGAPYKSRATELLIRLLSEPTLYPVSRLPDISGIQHNVYRYMRFVQTNEVSPEIRLILEMCISFELYGELVQLKTEVTRDMPLPPFNPNPPKVSLTDDCNALRDVHRLARNLYYGSLPDASYLQYVCESLNEEWTEENYHALSDAMCRFERVHDVQLMNVFHQTCVLQKVSPAAFNIAGFFLTQEDLIRYNSLTAFSAVELRQRLALIQLLNRQLSTVIRFIDLMDMSQENRLGSILCAMPEYINPATKESVLQLSIKETRYDPSGSRPVIVLDSMRTYEDPEDQSHRAPILFNESVTKSAFTSQCTFAQMFREVMKIDTNILRAPLDKRDRLFAVKYKGEQGLDFGGLYRDTIERCVEDLFSDRIDLFLPCPNSRAEEGINEEKYLPNSKYRHSIEVMDMYIFVGHLIGISLRTKQQLAFELPSMIWKYLIGSQPAIEDLEMIDTEFTNLLKSIREFDEEEAEEPFYDTFGLTFSVSDLAGNEIELIPGGEEIPVTYDTAEKWCELALEFKLSEFKQASEAICCGIQALVPQRSIALFTWDQLERAVCGEPDIDIEDLKAHTIYSNWTEQHPVVKRFWKVMEGLDNKDRSQFLRFAWGRSRLPHRDNWPRPFRLCARNYGDDMLPLAHTCFFELELPQYSSEQIMRERLLIAIHYGASEFMLR